MKPFQSLTCSHLLSEFNIGLKCNLINFQNVNLVYKFI